MEILRDGPESSTPAQPVPIPPHIAAQDRLLSDYNELRRRITRVFTVPLTRRQGTVAHSAHVLRPRGTDETVDLQVTVLVAMPFPSMAQDDMPAKETIPDVALGTASMPWDKEKLAIR